MPVRVFLPPCTRGLVFIAAIVLRSGFFQTDEESCVPITVHIDRHPHRCQPFHTTVRRQIVHIHVQITITQPMLFVTLSLFALGFAFFFIVMNFF